MVIRRNAGTFWIIAARKRDFQGRWNEWPGGDESKARERFNSSSIWYPSVLSIAERKWQGNGNPIRISCWKEVEQVGRLVRPLLLVPIRYTLSDVILYTKDNGEDIQLKYTMNISHLKEISFGKVFNQVLLQ